jgi:hypothetical protein
MQSDNEQRVMNTNKEIPVPHENAHSIVALVKESGQVTGYELSDGSFVSREEGVQMAHEGMIRDVAIAENKGTEYLRSLPDDSEDNNMGNLPVRNRESLSTDDTH